MLERINKMQEEMQTKQAELEEKAYTATSGGGMVQATVNGKHRVLSLEMKPEVVDPEDTEMLSDLICAAINAAVEEASKDYETTMEAITGGLNLPGLG